MSYRSHQGTATPLVLYRYVKLSSSIYYGRPNRASTETVCEMLTWQRVLRSDEILNCAIVNMVEKSVRRELTAAFRIVAVFRGGR
jgi:hypothetical protein